MKLIEYIQRLITDYRRRRFLDKVQSLIKFMSPIKSTYSFNEGGDIHFVIETESGAGYWFVLTQKYEIKFQLPIPARN